MKEYNTPILLITFNRPQHTRRVLEAIMAVQPRDLYVFQDGAREGNESDASKCVEVRQVIEELTEGKQVRIHKNFQERNLGCGPGPFEAMTWFFKNEEKGIIMEDDIDPHPLFFPYMDDLLERYKDDERIGIVTGHNYERYYSSKNSYYFTFEPAGTWGWGTWRRVWKGFDFDIPYNDEKLNAAYRDFGLAKLCRRKYCNIYKGWMSGSRHDVWDYQFTYYLLVNHYLNIRPNSCLTSNKGDGPDATHTFVGNGNFEMSVNAPLFENLRHPSSIKIDRSVKWRMFKKEVHLMLKKCF